MNLKTDSGLSIQVDDLTYFRFDDGVKYESFSRIVLGGVLVFTDWMEMYETLRLKTTNEIVRALDRAASELADERAEMEASMRADARAYFNR